MGTGNARAVFGIWGRLPDKPFRVLAFMALTVLDEHEPPIFWGGREYLSVGIGRPAPAAGTPEANRQRAAIFESIRDAISQLVAAGAIIRVTDPKPGQTAEYQLILDPRAASVYDEQISKKKSAAKTTKSSDLVKAQPVPNGTGMKEGMVQGKPGEWHRPSLGMVQGNPVPERDEHNSRTTKTPTAHSSTPTQVSAREPISPTQKASA